MKKFYIILISLFLFACSNETPLASTKYINDTIIVIKSDTVLTIDTVLQIPINDTIIQSDTIISVLTDTLIKFNNITNSDTIIKIDTLIKVNTTKIIVHDTILQINSIMVHDTLIDTLITTKTDTLHAYKRNLFIVDLTQWESGNGLIGNVPNLNMFANMMINYINVYSFKDLVSLNIINQSTFEQKWADGIRHIYVPNAMMQLDNGYGSEQQIWTMLKANNVIDSICLLRNGIIYASGKYKSATEFHLRFEGYNPTVYMRFTVGTNGYLTYLSNNVGG